MADVTSIAREQLKSIVERIERLEEEKAALAGDIKEVYAEAKAKGYDTKTLRTVIRLRKQDSAERQEPEALLDLYLHALGMAGEPEEDDRDVRRVAASPGVRAVLKRMGTPVEPTAEERAKGVVAAFDKDGTRISIATAGHR